ncbi:hypothetical protein HK102_010594 [Quaeritorhiza haematococci]|nr:hypothetical protein HK102_010594 [Quaeritorhiza haematococci]
MSKYSTLPDLDTAQDVYETPDISADDPSSLAAPGPGGALSRDSLNLSDFSSDDDNDNDEIVRSSLTVSTASQRFTDAVLDSSNVDFSGQIKKRTKRVRRRLSRRLPDREEYAILPYLGGGVGAGAQKAGGAVEKETTLQRLRRLMFEVQDLGEELEKEKAEALATVPAPVAAALADDVSASDAAASAEANLTTSFPPKTGIEIGRSRSGKKKLVSHGQLLEQVATLQADLVKIGQSVGQPLEGHSESIGTSGGTLFKQLEVGKTLMAQLKAFKDLSLNNGLSAASTSTADSSQQLQQQQNQQSNNQILTTTTTTTTSSTTMTTLQQSDPNVVTYELYYSPETAKLAHLSKVAELEARITQLERLIGTHFVQNLDNGDDSVATILQSSGSLVSALDRLDRHLALLTQPRQLDAVARRVKSLTADLEKLADLRKKQQLESSLTLPSDILRSSTTAGGTSTVGGAAADVVVDMHPHHQVQTENERKINHLFSTLEKLDSVSAVIPHLLARLHALRSLHTEAAVFSESLRLLTVEQGRIGETTKTMEDALKRVEGSLKENGEITVKNVEALEGRMKALGEKVEELMKVAAEREKVKQEGWEPAAIVEKQEVLAQKEDNVIVGEGEKKEDAANDLSSAPANEV